MNCCPATVHWTALVTPFLLAFIALLGAWIAYRQSEIARNKLKLDLFDKRAAVHGAARRILGSVMREGKLADAAQWEYFRDVSAAKWLFGDEVAEYLETTLWDMFVKLNFYNDDIENRAANAAARMELFRKITMQWEVLDRLCAPYMQVSDLSRRGGPFERFKRKKIDK